MAGKSEEALNYEVIAMQKFIDQGHDEGHLELSRDVAEILNSVRTNWGLKYPFD